jgi:hypothetical protein
MTVTKEVAYTKVKYEPQWYIKRNFPFITITFKFNGYVRLLE